MIPEILVFRRGTNSEKEVHSESENCVYANSPTHHKMGTVLPTPQGDSETIKKKLKTERMHYLV
jgi:hypothetical protein